MKKLSIRWKTSIGIALLLISNQLSAQLAVDSSAVKNEVKHKPIEKLLGANTDLEAVAISPTGKILAAGGWDKNIYIYSLEAESFGVITHTLKTHTSAILSLDFDRRGEYLVCGSNDYTITTWKVDSFLNQGTFRQSESIANVNYGPSPKYMYSGAKNGVIKLWDTKDSKRTRTIETNLKLNDFILSKDRKSIYVASESNSIIQYNLKGIEMGRLEGHTAFVNSIDLSANGQYLASGSDDKTIIVWELQRRKEKVKLTGHTSKINSVVISSDNKYVVSGDHSGEVIIWSIETGEIIKRIPGLGKSVRNISMSRLMDVIAVASYENSGNEHVVYVCQTGVINVELEKKRKLIEQRRIANERKKAREAEAAKETEEIDNEED